MQLLSEHQALRTLLEATPAPGAPEALPLSQALQRRSASDLLADVPLPGFDNSMMDGYALRASDSESASPLRVVAEQPAGRDRHHRIEKGTAIRIFTGAPLPQGADAVIMQEDVQREGDTICCLEPVSEGENIRRLGSDLCVGQKILSSGQTLTPGRLGLLATQGFDRVSVCPLPRVAVLSTGDELVPPDGRKLEAGQLYNSNGTMLQALVRELLQAEATTLHCADSLEATRQALETLASGHDVILLSGGVSVGDHDYVKPALSLLGMPPELWRIQVKPGKPFLFTHRERPTPLQVFGLPGNPVSAFVTFQLFVRPALLKQTGAPETEWTPREVKARLAQPLANDGNRPHYLRGQLDSGRFTVTGLQRSDALFALSQANALLRLPAGESWPEDREVDVMPL